MLGIGLRLLFVGRAGRGLEGLLRQDLGVEDGQRRHDRRIRVLQLDGDGLGVVHDHVLHRGEQEAPDAEIGRRRALQRPLHVFRRDRRPVGELDAVAQRQCEAQTVVGELPVGGEAGLHALAVIGRQKQRVVEVRQDPDVDVGVLQHRIEKQAVGVAAIGQNAAALHRKGSRARSDQQARCNGDLRQMFHATHPSADLPWLL